MDSECRLHNDRRSCINRVIFACRQSIVMGSALHSLKEIKKMLPVINDAAFMIFESNYSEVGSAPRSTIDQNSI